MTEQELIDLVQDRLPEELTAEQIGQLRAAMRSSPQVQECLLRELRLEEALATQFAPPAPAFDALLTRIRSRLAEERSRASRRATWIWLAIAALAIGIGLSIALRPASGPTSPAGSVAAGPASAASAPSVASRPDDVEPASGPSTLPSVALVEPDVADDPDEGAEEPEEPPATTTPAASSGPAPSPVWMLYARGLAPTPDWESRLPRLLQPAPQTDRDRRTARLGGVHRILALPKADRMLRLALGDVKRLAIEFRADEAGVRVEWGADGYVNGLVLRRDGKPAKSLAARERGAWLLETRSRAGGIDLRWQNGELIVARGDYAVIRLPLPKPPTEGTIHADAYVRSMDYLVAKPLPLDLAISPPPAQLRQAAEVEWKTSAAGKASFVRRDDGSVELSAVETAPEAHAVLAAPWAPGVDIEMRITASALAGILVGDPADTQGRTSHRLGFVEHAGQTVLLAGKEVREVAQAMDQGLAMPPSFWVRWRYGIDAVQLWISPDGDHWAMLAAMNSDRDRIVPPQAGIYLSASDRKRSISVSQVRLRTWDALTRLVEPSLRGAATKPADTADWKWWLAARAAILSRPASFKARETAAAEMLQTAIDQYDLPDAPIEALAQATVLLSPPPKNEDRRWLGLLYDEAARSCTASDRGDRLVDLVKATVAAVPPRDAGRGAVTFPESFVRYQLLDLAGRRRWHDLVLAAGRLAWLMNLDPAPEKDDRSLANFVAWAMAEGRLQAGEAVISEAADRVLHPLMAEPEHEATMLMAEFDASLRSGDGVRALELLTRQSLPAGLSVHRADEQLLLPLHLAIREQLRARPDLQRLLRERYEPLATMRLQRAAREGNADAIAAVAVQFHGTPAAASALVLLADRDLSAGNFYAAAARYKVALDGPGLANSAQVAAKHRLASAMAGEEAGSPVTQDIALPDGKVSATEFESIIATLLANRSRRPEWSAVRREPLAPPVSDYTATVLSTIRGGSNDEAWRLGEGGGRTVLAREGQLIVVDPRQGQILWSLNPPAKTRDTMSWAPPTPVVAANHLVLRHNFGAGQELACFDLERGRLLWHQKYDDGLTGDAALAEGSVYALSRRSSGATQELMLRRVSPENRTSAVAAPVVALREQSGGLCVAGPLVLKDLIVVQANGSLICLDLQGEVRWLRKLLYVPRQVDLVGQRPQPVVLPAGADTIVVLAPGCPQVLCIEVRTGQVLWSCFRPDARAILGPSERQVVLMTDRTVEGLDIATGRVTWRRGLGADAVGILSGPQRHVLLVTSVRNEKTKRSAWHMTWLSAKDGRTVASRSPGELDASPGQGLHTDGGVIYAPVRNGQIVLLKPK